MQQFFRVLLWCCCLQLGISSVDSQAASFGESLQQRLPDVPAQFRSVTPTGTCWILISPTPSRMVMFVAETPTQVSKIPEGYIELTSVRSALDQAAKYHCAKSNWELLEIQRKASDPNKPETTTRFSGSLEHALTRNLAQ